MNRTFQVDLRGVVDLLSHHLYASPRVYVRELLQNAVDAITARRAGEPDAPGRVLFEPPEVTGDGTLRVSDTGIGLTEAQVHELLATIGRSSKRDDLGFARHEFLGQFGIGLLSCFLVADEIRVDTRAAGAPAVRWTGYADGRYSLEPAEHGRVEVGTTVTLAPRRGSEQWLTGATVVELAGLYGSLLPCEVGVAMPDGWVPVTEGALPWAETSERRATLIAYAQKVFGFTPIDVIDLDVAEAGLAGVAFVLPQPANPAARTGHRVYLKRMLLAEGAEGLLPEWAFFARCVVDASELKPTASREALYDDALLESTREALGEQLRDWLVNGGYIYESQIIERLPAVERGVLIERLEPSDLTTRFDVLDPAVELGLRPMLAQAQRALDRLGCEVVLRAYEPAALPALYLANRAAAFAAELRATRERVDDVWAGVLDALADTAADERPQLVLNHRNPLVRRVTSLDDPEVVRLAVQALYGQALLLGYHPVRPADAALLNSSFLGLLNLAVPPS